MVVLLLLLLLLLLPLLLLQVVHRWYLGTTHVHAHVPRLCGQRSRHHLFNAGTN
jgi:hypothetical protein